MAPRSPDPEPLTTLADFIQFVARSGVSQRQRQRLNAAANSPLTGAELDALRAVREHGPVTTTALAARTHLDRTTVSRIVTRLEELDCIVRTTDAIDRRHTWISVAPTGKKLLRALDRVSAQDFQVALEHWSTDDRAALGQLLARLKHDLERLTFDQRGWAIGLQPDDGEPETS